ncbi:MAG: hypothetical protein MR051_01155 [Lentisphaeria bacterium]|nr:hypothetical protein [Lentisphaeria bacterium]
MSKLQIFRLKSGLRSVDLARMLHVSRACICLAEKKGLRSSTAAKRYAAALGCNWRDLLD